MPLIGREQELSLLVQNWRLAGEGKGQVVLLSGEAGIGKSRLAQALLEEVCGQLHTLVRYQCFAHQVNQPFYPVLGYMWYAAGFLPGESSQSRLDKLEAMAAQSQIDPAKLPYLAAIARALLERGTDRLDSAPEIVAHHLTAADNVEAAVRYWLRAAEFALSARG